MNPDGFMSILTKFKWKSSAIKSGSDDFCQAELTTLPQKGKAIATLNELNPFGIH